MSNNPGGFIVSHNLRIVLAVVAVGVVGFIVLQFVPGFAPTNPPVTTQIQWDSPKTQELMRRACMDCHSNETVWPWYSTIAPVSWLVVHDVDEGRSKMNLSTGFHVEAREMIREIQRGTMPKPIYLPLHPEANLTDAEKADLIAGIQATFKRG
jgi:hypothetical protein